MSSARTQLEDAQVRVKQLEHELSTFPTTSPERARLEHERSELTSRLAEAMKETASLELRQEALRVSVSDAPWWRSPLSIPLAIAGFVGSCVLSSHVISLGEWSWPSLAMKIGRPVAYLPLVVNALRYARGRWKLARRRQLGGGMKTE